MGVFLVEFGERGGHLGKLHQADRAFHHAGTAGTGNGDEWLASLDGKFDATRYFFSDNSAHRAADEANSMAQSTTGRPLSWPSAVMMARSCRVFSWLPERVA